jgi:hypothetical protein
MRYLKWVLLIIGAVLYGVTGSQILLWIGVVGFGVWGFIEGLQRKKGGSE